MVVHVVDDWDGGKDLDCWSDKCDEYRSTDRLNNKQVETKTTLMLCLLKWKKMSGKKDYLIRSTLMDGQRRLFNKVK